MYLKVNIPDIWLILLDHPTQFVYVYQIYLLIILLSLYAGNRDSSSGHQAKWYEPQPRDWWSSNQCTCTKVSHLWVRLIWIAFPLKFFNIQVEFVLICKQQTNKQQQQQTYKNKCTWPSLWVSRVCNLKCKTKNIFCQYKSYSL